MSGKRVLTLRFLNNSVRRKVWTNFSVAEHLVELTILCCDVSVRFFPSAVEGVVEEAQSCKATQMN